MAVRDATATLDPRERTLAIIRDLDALGVEIPDAARGGDARWLPLLDVAEVFAERHRRLELPADASARWPVLRIHDGLRGIDVAVSPVTPVGAGETKQVALDASRSLGVPERPRVLVLDHRKTRVTEVLLETWLYGNATYYASGRAPPPADERINEAAERGWIEILRETNLLPANHMVIEAEHAGLYLTDTAFDDVAGILALFPKSDLAVEPNPFATIPRPTDIALATWFYWGTGRASRLQ